MCDAALLCLRAHPAHPRRALGLLLLSHRRQQARGDRRRSTSGDPPPLYHHTPHRIIVRILLLLTLRTLAVLSAFSYSAIAASKLGATAGAAHQVISITEAYPPPYYCIHLFIRLTLRTLTVSRPSLIQLSPPAS